MNLEALLPRENPACVHEWHPDVCRAVFVCETCGYELSVKELLGPHEGEIPVVIAALA